MIKRSARNILIQPERSIGRFLPHCRRSCLSAIIKSSIFSYVPWFLILGWENNISHIIQSYRDQDQLIPHHLLSRYRLIRSFPESWRYPIWANPIQLTMFVLFIPLNHIFPMVKPPLFNAIFHGFFHGKITGGLPCVVASPEDDHVKREDVSCSTGSIGSTGSSFGVKLLVSK